MSVNKEEAEIIVKLDKLLCGKIETLDEEIRAYKCLEKHGVTLDGLDELTAERSKCMLQYQKVNKFMLENSDDFVPTGIIFFNDKGKWKKCEVRKVK
jgi:hypothetical protein